MAKLKVQEGYSHHMGTDHSEALLGSLEGHKNETDPLKQMSLIMYFGRGGKNTDSKSQRLEGLWIKPALRFSALPGLAMHKQRDGVLLPHYCPQGNICPQAGQFPGPLQEENHGQSSGMSTLTSRRACLSQQFSLLSTHHWEQPCCSHRPC